VDRYVIVKASCLKGSYRIMANKTTAAAHKIPFQLWSLVCR